MPLLPLAIMTACFAVSGIGLLIVAVAYQDRRRQDRISRRSHFMGPR